MDEKNSIAGPARRVLWIVLPGLFAALTYVLGLVQIVRLNLEAKTVTIFLAGYVVGVAPGACTGVLATILHQFLNPFGPAHPFTCVAQGLAWSLTGVAGGLTGRESAGYFRMAAIGTLLTVGYHALTDLAESQALGIPFWVFCANGFAPPYFFTPVHVISNALLFTLVAPLLWPVLTRLREELGRR